LQIVNKHITSFNLKKFLWSRF